MTVTGDPATVLTFNSGSSSLKFGLYRDAERNPTALLSGEIEALGDGHCRLRATDDVGTSLLDETVVLARPSDGVGRLGALFDSARRPAPAAIGHRIVHGGPSLRHHCLIDQAVQRALDVAVAFAPVHMPPALALIRYAQEHYPGLPQVACLDTAFHADMPEVASTLPLPGDVRAQGIKRYGFHGLSCESIMRRFGNAPPDRLVIAHLGNGASITAVKAGRSVDTSMGLTPSGGVIMGTRTGDIDPGILLYLLRGGQFAEDELEDVLDHRSGLAGLSGISSDVRRLKNVADAEPGARLALEMFRISVAKQIAGMVVVLGGVDALVFTGGIGENDAETRDGIVGRLSFCGIRLDEERSGAYRNPISVAGSGVTVFALPSREDDEIARHTHRLAGTALKALVHDAQPALTWAPIPAVSRPA